MIGKLSSGDVGRDRKQPGRFSIGEVAAVALLIAVLYLLTLLMASSAHASESPEVARELKLEQYCMASPLQRQVSR